MYGKNGASEEAPFFLTRQTPAGEAILARLAHFIKRHHKP